MGVVAVVKGRKRTEEVVGVSGESANLFSLFFEVNFHSTDLFFMFYKKKAGFKIEITFKISLRTGSVFNHNKAFLT